MGEYMGGPLRSRNKGDLGEVIPNRRRHPGLEPGPALFLTATMEKLPSVYILAKASHGTLYTGVTSDLPARVWQDRWETGRRSGKRVGHRAR